MGQRASEYIKGFTFAASFDHFWRIHEQAAATR
jgi:hypothetical protein